MVIGIVARNVWEQDKVILGINRNNLQYLEDKVNCIGILSYDRDLVNHYEVLKLCDGVIIPGGNDICSYHYDIVRYCRNNNIPLLGICMGHQIIGLVNNGQPEDDLIIVDNHCDKLMKHRIRMEEGTWLERVLGKEIMVNSRHKQALREVKKPMIVSAWSDDGVIEAIEDIDDNHFLIGVQWHPEDMEGMEKLYNAFMQEVWFRKKRKMIDLENKKFDMEGKAI